MQFPIVTGFNLQRKKLTLPQDFKGSVNLIFIAFQQWQQKQVDTWVPYAQQLEQVYDGLLYYELPTIRKLNLFSRTLINEGMGQVFPIQQPEKELSPSMWIYTNFVILSNCQMRITSSFCFWISKIIL